MMFAAGAMTCIPDECLCQLQAEGEGSCVGPPSNPQRIFTKSKESDASPSINTALCREPPFLRQAGREC